MMIIKLGKQSSSWEEVRLIALTLGLLVGLSSYGSKYWLVPF
ncbi:hypothetical protein [Nostoc sp.]